MSTFRIKRFTQYDQTDQLKLMKDSDILAQRKRSNAGNYATIAGAAAVGAAGLGIPASMIGAGKGLISPEKVLMTRSEAVAAAKAKGKIRLAAWLSPGKKLLTRTLTAGQNSKKYGKRAALAGGIIAGGTAYLMNRNNIKENKFYNKRLTAAQEMSKRRESDDWQNNITNRTNYTY